MARKRDKKRNLKPYLLGAGGLAGAVGLGALGARTKGGKEVVQRIRGFIRGGKPVTGHSRTVTQAASATPGAQPIPVSTTPGVTSPTLAELGRQHRGGKSNVQTVIEDNLRNQNRKGPGVLLDSRATQLSQKVDEQFRDILAKGRTTAGAKRRKARVAASNMGAAVERGNRLGSPRKLTSPGKARRVATETATRNYRQTPASKALVSVRPPIPANRAVVPYTPGTPGVLVPGGALSSTRQAPATRGGNLARKQDLSFDEIAAIKKSRYDSALANREILQEARRERKAKKVGGTLGRVTGKAYRQLREAGLKAEEQVRRRRKS